MTPALKPLTYMSLLNEFTGQRFNVPRTVRNNTQVMATYDDDMMVIFEVVLHGSTIAVIGPQGVQVWAGKFRTATTRNRLNDVLLPIGYALVSGWKVVRLDSEIHGDVLDFEDGMTIKYIK